MMNKRKYGACATRWLLWSFFLAQIAGCTTLLEPSVPPTHPEAVRAEISRRITGENPAEAFPILTRAARQNTLTQSALDELRERGVSAIRARYEEARRTEEFGIAISEYQNLVALGAESRNDQLISELYLERARKLEDSRSAGASIATLLQAPRIDLLPRDALATAAELARSLNNRYAVSVLSDVLGSEWVDSNREIFDFSESIESPSTMAAGVVTVWVNRGIRLEGGLGIPDRVIGSGFFIDPEGYLVTNYHVIASEVDPTYEGYSRLYVRLASDPDQRIPARVVGFSPIFDVALLKVEVPVPYVFSFTNIRALEPGARILAIGSPGGLETSITSGIISATGRRFLQMGEAMQVDVAINPGNSGGPLLDNNGRLVGVVFAGIEQFEGVNFAVPSFWVHPFLAELYKEGEVNHPWLGAAVQPVSGGLEITYVDLGGPASVAGLEVGDLITTIGGFEVQEIEAAHSILLDSQPGSLMPITWEREGGSVEGLVALDRRPRRPLERAIEDDLVSRLYPVLYGMAVEKTGRSFFRDQFTVTEVYPGSLADELGITRGDSFTEFSFVYEKELGVVFLRMFIAKRTDGFMRTNLQLPAYIERNNFI
ncbi:MAG: S1C family serine protease [Spirochaetales bacterium]